MRIQALSRTEIDSIGVQILADQLTHDGWKITETNLECAANDEPQIIGEKDGELAFFVVRTAVLPDRGRFDGGLAVYEKLVRLAKSRGATCYFASLGIARSNSVSGSKIMADTETEAFDVQFEGLVRMELAANDVREIA